jgi:hypothetical protein
VAGQGLDGERHPTGPGHDGGDRGRLQARRDAAGQVGGLLAGQRRHRQPAGGGRAQRVDGAGRQAVRGAQRDHHAAVRGDRRQGR